MVNKNSVATADAMRGTSTIGNTTAQQWQQDVNIKAEMADTENGSSIGGDTT